MAYISQYGDFGDYPTLESAFNPTVTKNVAPAPSYPGQATTQPTGQTAAATGGFNPWTDVGGGVMVPNFQESDWEWRDPVASQTFSSGDNDWTSPGQAGGWFMTDAARSRLGWDDWGSNYWANVNWEGGLNPHGVTIDPNSDRYWDGRSYGDTGSAGTFNQARYDEELAAMKAKNPLLAGNFTAVKKIGDRTGQRVRWNGLNAAQGTGTEDFYTNPGEMNKKVAISLAALAGGGLLGNLAMTGNALTAAGAAGEAASFGAGAGSGLTALGEGAVAPLSSAPTIGEAGAGTLNSIWDTAKTGYDYYNKAKKGLGIYNALTADSPQQRTRMTPPMDGTQNGVYSNGMPGQGGFDWSKLPGMVFGGGGSGNTGLMDLWGAFEGSRQMKDLSGNMKNIYEQELAKRDQPLNMLNQSYANPDVFYNSSQWKGLSDVYKNNVDRMAGKGGTLANPTQREQLLNNYALKELENWRSGLRQQAGVYKPSVDAITRGYEAEARANNPWGALGGRGSIGGPGTQGGAGGIEQIIRQIMGGGGGYGNSPGVGSIEDIIRRSGGQGPGGVGMGGWSPGGDVGMPSYNPWTGEQGPVFGGDTWGDGPVDWGNGSLPSFNDWGMPQIDPGYAFSGGAGSNIGNFDFGSAPVEDIGDFLGSFLEW